MRSAMEFVKSIKLTERQACAQELCARFASDCALFTLLHYLAPLRTIKLS